MKYYAIVDEAVVDTSKRRELRGMFKAMGLEFKSAEPIGKSPFALVTGKAPRGLRTRLTLAVLPKWLHVLRQCDDEENPPPKTSAQAMQMARQLSVI